MIEAYRACLARDGCVRVVNHHNTPASRATQLDAQFAALARRYGPVTEDALDRFLATGRWPGDRPGVVPAFYNGYRNNFDVALPLLDRHGLTGWFFAVPGYTSCPAAEQTAFAAARMLETVPCEYADGRQALSWDELAEIERRGHVVASHTRTHTPVRLDDPRQFFSEVVDAQGDFERHLGHPVRAFAWLRGGRYGEMPIADRAVDAAGYDFLFSNLAIQRLPGGRRQAA